MLRTWGEETNSETSVCVRLVHLVCKLLELRLTRVKVEGLLWQNGLQCRLSKISIILNIFLARAAAVKLLLTLQLKATLGMPTDVPVTPSNYSRDGWVFFYTMSHNSEGSGKNVVKLHQLS